VAVRGSVVMLGFYGSDWLWIEIGAVLFVDYELSLCYAICAWICGVETEIVWILFFFGLFCLC